MVVHTRANRSRFISTVSARSDLLAVETAVFSTLQFCFKVRDLVFVIPEKGSGRRGTLTLGNDSFPLALQDLPTVCESYKTYDDVNLVKTANIGQARHL